MPAWLLLLVNLSASALLLVALVAILREHHERYLLAQWGSSVLALSVRAYSVLPDFLFAFHWFVVVAYPLFYLASRMHRRARPWLS